MRIPLFRWGGDETPLAWWEWFFAPITMPVFFIVLAILAGISIPVTVIYRLQCDRNEKGLRHRLTAVGRSIEWAAVETKLMAGVGTLIVEYFSPKGPIREWWTEDDLIPEAPVSLPTSVGSLPGEGQRLPLHEYANACKARYTNVETGTAFLTDVPWPLLRKNELSKVVTLVVWSDPPLLFAGDPESIFTDGPKST